MGLKKDRQITGYEQKKHNRSTTVEIQPSQ